MNNRRQLDLFKDPLDYAVDDLLEDLDSQGVDRQAFYARLLFRQTASQVKKLRSNLRDQFVLWMVEEFIKE